MGRKLTKEEYVQRKVFPLLEKVHGLCKEREIPFFFVVRCSEEGGAAGIVASNEDGDTLPFAEEVIELRRHHEMMTNGSMRAIKALVAQHVRHLADKVGKCDGNCAACEAHEGKPEVDA
jgi:ribosomal protein L7Ae-like RNA K-turn-binding protein